MIAAPQMTVSSFGFDGPSGMPSNFDSGYIGHVHLLPSCIEPSCASEFVHIQKKQRSSRRVRFSDEAPTVVEAVSTMEDLEKAWYQREELRKIREDCKMCLLAYNHVGRKAALLPSTRFSIRGIETSLSRSSGMLARHTRKETVRAILLAQKGFPDPSHLRLISELKSKGQVRDAIRMAAKDSKIWLEEYKSLQVSDKRRC